MMTMDTRVYEMDDAKAVPDIPICGMSRKFPAALTAAAMLIIQTVYITFSRAASSPSSTFPTV